MITMFLIKSKLTGKRSYAFKKNRDHTRLITVFIEPKEGFQDPLFNEMSLSEFDEQYEVVLFKEVDAMEMFKIAMKA